jgi:hypothetical protein
VKLSLLYFQYFRYISGVPLPSFAKRGWQAGQTGRATSLPKELWWFRQRHQSLRYEAGFNPG